MDNLLTDIAENNPNVSAWEAQAIKRGHDKYLQLEYAACYGGYRVVNVKIGNGAHYGAFGMSSCVKRLSFTEMYHMLSGILIGLEMNKEVLV